MSSVIWTVSVAECAWTRRCPRCDRHLPHPFTGRARLNANGKRLDAWLLFACCWCARTAKWPLLERVAVSSIPPHHLDALHANDADVLWRMAREAVGGVGLVVEGAWAPVVELRVEAGVKARLDRVLAVGLGLPRATVAGWDLGKALRRPVKDGQRVALPPLRAG